MQVVLRVFRVQHVAAEQTAVLSDDLVVNHHRERSVQHNFQRPVTLQQRFVTAVTTVRRQQQQAIIRQTMKISNAFQRGGGKKKIDRRQALLVIVQDAVPVRVVVIVLVNRI